MSDLEIISRREAAAQGLRRFYTGRPCIHGHLAERYVSTAGCVGCLRQYSPRRNGQMAVAKGIAHFPPQAFTFLENGAAVSQADAEATFRYMSDQQWHMHALAQLRASPELMAHYSRPPLTRQALEEAAKTTAVMSTADLAALLELRKSKSQT